jgi:hypothetical protein
MSDPATIKDLDGHLAALQAAQLLFFFTHASGAMVVIDLEHDGTRSC